MLCILWCIIFKILISFDTKLYSTVLTFTMYIFMACMMYICTFSFNHDLFFMMYFLYNHVDVDHVIIMNKYLCTKKKTYFTYRNKFHVLHVFDEQITDAQ